MLKHPGKAWPSVALEFAPAQASPHPERPTASLGEFADIQQPQAGLWALAQSMVTQQSAAVDLLAAVRQQVESGEDLTAAFLCAHGRLQREADSAGAQLIAMRRSHNSIELAWVGAMRAWLVRNRSALLLSRDPVPAEGSDSQRGGYLIATERLPQLGVAGKTRPKLDRNLVHAERGDYLVLCGDQVDIEATASALSEGLKGIWNFQYKARKVQGLLAAQAHTAGRVVLCQVL